MSDLVTQDLIVDAIMDNAGRCTLPFHEAVGAGGFATAFWYNHLDGDEVSRYLVTAEAASDLDTADWILRPGLGEPEVSAEHLVMFNFADKWARIPQLGIAVLPAAELDAYADRKGWRWTVDEITEGLAARSADVATIGLTPMAAYLLGHNVGAGKERIQTVFVGAVAMDLRGKLRWMAALPEGCVGSPVFVSVALGGGDFKLVCLGLVLSGEDPCEIIPFDRIRRAVADLSAPQPRHWWRRRGRTSVPAPRRAPAVEAVLAGTTAAAENEPPAGGAVVAPFVNERSAHEKTPSVGRAAFAQVVDGLSAEENAAGGTSTTGAVPPVAGSTANGAGSADGDRTVENSPAAVELPRADSTSRVESSGAVDGSLPVDGLIAVDGRAVDEVVPVGGAPAVEDSRAVDGAAVVYGARVVDGSATVDGAVAVDDSATVESGSGVEGRTGDGSTPSHG